MTERRRARVGVSACLLGQAVRYDGADKYEPVVAQTLAQVFELVAVCPEVELGLGVPREPVGLVRDGAQIRLIASESGTDHTDAMRAYARRRIRELERLRLAGYVFKKNSPSCGVVHVEVVGQPNGGRGLFADELMRHLTELPVEEEAALREPGACERFVERVLAYERRHAESQS